MTPLLQAVIRIARDAGAEVMEVYARDFAVDYKDDRSPLTDADRRAHALIAARLAEVAVNGQPLPVLSEEGRDRPYAERRAWDAFWLVDPLDGSKEFIKRNGEFTVNVALVRAGRPVLGVVFGPAVGRLYAAEEGSGAFRAGGGGDGFVRLPDRPLPATVTAVASRSHLDPRTEAFIADLRRRHGAVESISSGSSLKFCLVAEGRAHVYPRFAPTMEWDTAAAQAVVEAAGGRVVDAATGAPLRYNKPDLHNPFFLTLGQGVAGP